VSLRERNEQLNAALLKVNKLRNEVMHGDRELARGEALWSIDVIATVIAYLRENPFGVDVAGFPPLRPAEPQLSRMPDPTGEDDTGEERGEAAP
jgi:hypothetical protein